MNNFKTIPFHGSNFCTVEQNGIPHVAIKPVCEHIGLDWHSQRKRIHRNDVLNSVAVITTSTAKDGKSYQALALPIKYLNGWLFGISTKRIKDSEIRAKIITYQKECYDVLYNYWLIKNNATTVPQANPHALATAEQRKRLSNKIHYIVNHSPLNHEVAWQMVNMQVGVDSHKDMNEVQIDEAIKIAGKMLQEYWHEGEYQAADEPDTFRQSQPDVINNDQWQQIQTAMFTQLRFLSRTPADTKPMHWRYYYDALKTHFHIKSTRDLPASKYQEAMAWIKNKERDFIDFMTVHTELNTAFCKKYLRDGVAFDRKAKKQWSGLVEGV